MRLGLEEFMAMMDEDPDEAFDYLARVGGYGLLLEAKAFIKTLRDQVKELSQ